MTRWIYLRVSSFKNIYGYRKFLNTIYNMTFGSDFLVPATLKKHDYD